MQIEPIKYQNQDLTSPVYFVESHVFQAKSNTPNTNKKLTNKKKIIIISIVIILILILIAALIIIILIGVIPCSFTKCHPRASKCINHAFRAECQCDYGYQGDGLNYCDECGLRYTSANVRIVGGVEAVPNSWPSAALVIFSYKATVYLSDRQIYVTISLAYSCGGTLIDRRTILTAAHCIQDSVDFEYSNKKYSTAVTTNSFYPTIESMYKVYLGVHDKTKKTISPAFESSVSKVLKHENYNQLSKLNDIAILKLSNELKLNNYVQISCLPNLKQDIYPSETNIKSWAVGWGTLNYGADSGPNKLYNVDLTLYDSSKCANVSKVAPKNWESQICAGKIEGGKDTCQGDSGGSLFVSDSVNGATKLITAGIVSYGEQCALVGLPGIYTRVSYFNNWIQTNKWYWN